jgi:hypothetical protein
MHGNGGRHVSKRSRVLDALNSGSRREIVTDALPTAPLPLVERVERLLIDGGAPASLLAAALGVGVGEDAGPFVDRQAADFEWLSCAEEPGCAVPS